MTENASIIIDSSDEECSVRKKCKLDIIKLHPFSQNYNFQGLQIKGIKSDNEDVIVCLDDDEPDLDPDPIPEIVNNQQLQINIKLPKELENAEAKDEKSNLFNNEDSKISDSIVNKKAGLCENEDEIVCLDDYEPDLDSDPAPEVVNNQQLQINIKLPKELETAEVKDEKSNLFNNEDSKISDSIVNKKADLCENEDEIVCLDDDEPDLAPEIVNNQQLQINIKLPMELENEEVKDEKSNLFNNEYSKISDSIVNKKAGLCENKDEIVCLDDDEPDLDPDPAPEIVNSQQLQINIKLPKELENEEVKDKNIIQSNLINNEGSIISDSIVGKEADVCENENDIVCLDKDEPKSNETNEHCNKTQNKIPKRVELTVVKDQNVICSTRSNTPFETYEKDINKILTENNINEIQSSRNNENCEKGSKNLDRENSKEDIESTSIDETPTDVFSSEFKAFLEACSICDCDVQYKNKILDKIPNIQRKYNDADEKYIESEEFKKLCVSNIEKVQQKPKNAIIVFNGLYRELEAKKKQTIDLTDQEKRHLGKLYSTLRKIYKKIKKLETEEIDFEEDSNSSYIMLHRFQERLCLIKKKICSYTKENFYSGSYLLRNLDLSSSKYSEINRAVDKLYNKKKQFPSFYEVNQCIRKCVINNNINLSEDALTKEIQSVFNAMGSILQRRRKMELYESLSYFLDGAEPDPADHDPELSAVLEKRQEENEKKIDEVLQKYSDYQERGEDPSLSSDSDDSNQVSDNSDDS